MKDGVRESRRRRERDIERERQSARVRNVFPVLPWEHDDDESHVSIGWSKL